MTIEVHNTTETTRLPKKKITTDLLRVFESEKFLSNGITRVIFVDDNEIHRLNVEFLNHDYPTDVITFVINEEVDDFDAEIYISVDTAKKQAIEYEVSLHNEIRRLAIHGALHLVGYDDSTDELRSRMQAKENFYLER